MEFRFAELAEVEGRTLTGLALPFERVGRVGSMREKFARGSVQSSGSAILNVQHDRGRAIAREPETLDLPGDGFRAYSCAANPPRDPRGR